MKLLKHSEVWDMALDAAKQIVGHCVEEVAHHGIAADAALDAAWQQIDELQGTWDREIKERRKVWRLVELEKKGIEL